MLRNGCSALLSYVGLHKKVYIKHVRKTQKWRISAKALAFLPKVSYIRVPLAFAASVRISDTPLEYLVQRGDLDMELKKRVRMAKSTVWAGWPYLLIILVSFFVGAFCGFALAFLGDENLDLQYYLGDFIDRSAQGGYRLSFLSVLWDCVRWPLLVVICGLSAFGIVAVPAVLAVRGFLLAYAVAAFGVLFGNKGVAAAAVLFAATAILALPVLFVLGCEGLRTAHMQLSGGVASAVRYRPEVLLPGIGILAVSIALQWTLVPQFLSAVCIRLF